MNAEAIHLFWSYTPFIILVSVTGLYCMLFSFNLIRVLIGLELLIKAVTLLLIVVGYITHHEAYAQCMVITLIVIEVVMITVSIGIVVGIRGFNKSLDVRKIRNLKG